MDLGLRGKIAIVAAASKGLGKAVAMELANEGAEVAICARNAADLDKAASDIRSRTGRAVFAQALDVTNYAAVKAFDLVSAKKDGTRTKRSQLLAEGVGLLGRNSR